jgi:hypothetical protein
MADFDFFKISSPRTVHLISNTYLESFFNNFEKNLSRNECELMIYNCKILNLQKTFWLFPRVEVVCIIWKKTQQQTKQNTIIIHKLYIIRVIFGISSKKN